MTAEALELRIDPKGDRFSGKAEISLVLDEARTVLWIHGKGLEVRRAVVTPEGGAPVSATWEQRDRTGMASLTLASEVPAGRAKIAVEYEAPFREGMLGAYKVVEGGAPYVFTQFENVAAREAFPCFDEPASKIPFDLTLIVPSQITAVANTHEVDRTTTGASQRIHFAPTLPIPSYLVAFAVGPLEIVQGTDAPRSAVRDRVVPVRVVTTKGQSNRAAYAAAHTGEILATLERYFGIAYPYDKLDVIAVPGKPGAMENPGAVTFRDSLLLFDPASAPRWQLDSFASVVAHELAHQWTGDLVTAAWWDDIWLNEGFATWMAAKAADAWDPRSAARKGLLDAADEVMRTDTLASARSIRQPIASSGDIVNAFDSITYDKGAAVLGMFEHWVGPEVFARGVHDYLAGHAFANATADDFLRAVSVASGKDLGAAFHTFLDQPGVPFIEAELRCDGSPRLHLKQSRFSVIGASREGDPRWQVPVCVKLRAAGSTRTACTLLGEREGELPLGPACPDWVFPDADAAGYYRFTLAPKDRGDLESKGLASLSADERAAYARSLWAAAEQGYFSMADELDAARSLAADRDAHVATQAMDPLRDARGWLLSDPLGGAVEAYARKLFLPAYEKLGWQRATGDDENRRTLRGDVVAFLARTANDPVVRAEAKKRGLAYLGYGGDGELHPDAVDSDLRGIAIFVAGEEADGDLWDAMHARLAKTDDSYLRARLIVALAASKRSELAARVRAFPLDPVLRSSEVRLPVAIQLADPRTREAAWQWFKEHFDALAAIVPRPHGTVALIDGAEVFCDEAHAADVEAFFTPKRVAEIDGAPRALANTLETIRLCAAKRAVQEPSARAFFAQHR